MSSKQKKTKAVVSFSGGLDSTFCLYEALQNHDSVIAVSFDYNQKHKREIECAKRIVALCNGKFGERVRHIVVKVPKTLKFTKTSLVEGGSGSVDWEYDGSVPDTYVPMRNLVFSQICASIARRNGAKKVYLGISSADHFTSPKITKDWFLGFAIGAKKNDHNKYKYGHLIYNPLPDDIVEIRRWVMRRFGSDRYFYYDNGVFNYPFPDSAFLSCLRFFDGNLFRDEIVSIVDFMAGYFEGSLWTFSGEATLKLHNMSTVGPDFADLGNAILEINLHKNTVFKNSSVENCKVSAIAKFYKRIMKNDVVFRNGVVRIPLNSRWFEVFINRIRTLYAWKHLYQAAIEVNNRNVRGLNPPYPDCTPWFFHDLKNCVYESLDDDKIEFEAPLLYRTKAGVIVESVIKRPFLYNMWSLSHSAYDGSYPPKLQDASSKLRKEAFKKASVKDPMILRAYLDGEINQRTAKLLGCNVEEISSIDDALSAAMTKFVKKGSSGNFDSFGRENSDE